jgi:hypothetical protein
MCHYHVRGSRWQRKCEMRNRMREIRTSGSVGDLGANAPRSTWPIFIIPSQFWAGQIWDSPILSAEGFLTGMMLSSMRDTDRGRLGLAPALRDRVTRESLQTGSIEAANGIS